MTDNKIISNLEALANHEVFFGPQGFNHVNSEVELNKAQRGFGVIGTNPVDANENSLPVEQGSWQASWQVFARDTEMGDPYFVDINQLDLPVYTGFLGDQGWEIEQVATSLTAYVACINLLFNHGKQTQAQFFPDNSSVTDENILATLEQQLLEASSCQHFWQFFIGCYRDWLTED